MSSLYTDIQHQMLNGSFNVASNSFYVLLVNATYTPNFAADQTLAAVPSGAQLCVPQALEMVFNSFSSAFVAAPLTLTGVATTSAIEAIVIVKDIGGASSTWPLVAYVNEGLNFGEPAESANVQIVWDNRGIFAP